MRKVSFLTTVLLVLALSVAWMITGCSSSSDDGGSASPTTNPTGDGVISGKVTDSAGTALSGATISVVVNRDEKASTTTDENGQFTVENLATGQTYAISILQSGYKTITVLVELSDTDSTADFVINIPQGTGSASFTLPQPLVLNTPTLTGAVATFTWNKQKIDSLTFDRNYLFRKATSGVTTTDTMVNEITSSVTNSTTDVIPEPGRWHYKMFTLYTVTDQNVNVLLATNEVQTYVEKYVKELSWGTRGTEDSQFDRPYGIAIYETTNGVEAVYVSDGDDWTDNWRIQKFDKDGTHIATWTEYDDGGATTFGGVFGLDVDLEGNVYAAQGYRQNLTKLDADGNTLAVWTDLGSYSWSGTRDVAVDEHTAANAQTEPRIFVGIDDRYNSDYGVYTLGMDGTFDGLFTTTSNEDLHGVAIGPDGAVWIVEAGYDVLWKYSAEGAQLLSKQFFAYQGYNYYINNPHGVATDASGNVYMSARGIYPDYYYYSSKDTTSTPNMYSVMKLDSEGNAITALEEQLSHAHGIDVTADGSTIYVVDKYGYNVSKWVLDLEENE